MLGLGIFIFLLFAVGIIGGVAESCSDEKKEKGLKRIQETEAWYKEELENLKSEYDRKRKETALSMADRPHQIIEERNWPQISLSDLSNLALGEPLPPEFKHFDSGIELPLEEKFLGVFSSLKVWLNEYSGDLSSLPSIVGGIELEGRVDMSSVQDLISVRDMLLSKLDPIFRMDGEIDGGHPLRVCWRGLPNWSAELLIYDNNQYHNLGTVKFSISSNQGLVDLVRKRMVEEFRVKAEELDAEFAKRAEELKKENLQKIKSIKDEENESPIGCGCICCCIVAAVILTILLFIL